MINVSEVVTSSLTVRESRIDGGDCTTMVGLDRYVSAPEKQDIVKQFVLSIPDEHYEKYKALPKERQAYLLRLYAEKNHNTNLGIVPYTS